MTTPPEPIARAFLRRARAEGRRYGDDPWVFLRELAQNARDAGARRIRIATAWRDGRLELRFQDDGRGMTRAHARQYLFRLYASSKESASDAAGRFGVGFWSVLRFEPDALEVHSRTHRGRADLESAWGVWLDGGLSEHRWQACAQPDRGTTVVLWRSGREADLAAFRAEARAAGLRYLAHLRTQGLRARPLPVELDGTELTRPIGLPGAECLEFREGPVEGAVGLGPRPSYRLLARGLPVGEGAFLEELEAGLRRTRSAEQREGLAPVYLLNGNRLAVVLSRQEVVRDRALEHCLRVARRRFDELVARTIDQAMGRTIRLRLGAALREFLRGLAGLPVGLKLGAAVLLLLAVGGGLGRLVAPAAPETRPPARTPVAADRLERRSSPIMPDGWERSLRVGGVTSPSEDADEPGWALTYRPPENALFRLAVLEDFAPGRGWGPAGSSGPFVRVPPRPGLVGLELELELPAGLREGFLPVPSGTRVDGASARLGGRAVPLEEDDTGLLRAAEPLPGPGRLVYRALEDGGLAPAALSRMRGSLGLRLPAPLGQAVDQARRSPVEARPGLLVAAVQAALRYDRGPDTARRHAGRAGIDWVAEVTEIGAGDCDVQNGLLVLLLREAGLPARLAVGLAGHEGEALPGLHAWAEVWLDGRLSALDASTGASSAPAPSAVSPLPTSAPPETDRPALAVEGAPSPGGQSQDRLGWGLLGASLLALALLLLGLFGRRARLRARIGPEGRSALLAGMVEDALQRPQAWRHVPGLWHRPILPCLDGRRLSLAAMARRARQGLMFVGRQTDVLAQAARRARVAVLDAADPDFGPLFGRTAGLTELSELALDRPVPPEGAGERALLEALGRCLAKVGARVGLVDQDGDSLCHDVDLGPLRPPRGLGWPRRYVALHRRHPFVRALSERVALEGPGLAVALLTDRLVAESRLLGPRGPAARRAAARAALSGGRP